MIVLHLRNAALDGENAIPAGGMGGELSFTQADQQGRSAGEDADHAIVCRQDRAGDGLLEHFAVGGDDVAVEGHGVPVGYAVQSSGPTDPNRALPSGTIRPKVIACHRIAGVAGCGGLFMGDRPPLRFCSHEAPRPDARDVYPPVAWLPPGYAMRPNAIT